MCSCTYNSKIGMISWTSSSSPQNAGSAAAATAAALAGHPPFMGNRKAPPVTSHPQQQPSRSASCFLKLLVPDRLAGVIIGKGGSGIAELEQDTGATMRLSGNRIYFPGTSERVMVCGGEFASIEKLIVILVSKLNDAEAPQFGFRLVLTNSACSCIIGKGGETIKAISQQTGATIRASDRIENQTHERIVDIKAADSDAVVAAIRDITHKIQEDASFREYASVLNYYQPPAPVMPHESSYFYPNNPTSALAAAAAAAGAQSAGLARPHAPASVGVSAMVDQYPLAIEFHVPSAAVGAIIGKNGEARNRIVHSTGANVVVDARPADGLSDRKILISGPLAAVQAALTLVAKLIVESQ